MHTRILIGLFWMFVFPHWINSQDPASCVSYPDLSRTCTNIRRCPSLLNLMIQFGDFAEDYLQSTVCGCDGDDPLVCCPQQLPAKIMPLNEAHTSAQLQLFNRRQPLWQPKFSENCDYRNLPIFMTEDDGNIKRYARNHNGVAMKGGRGVSTETANFWRGMAMLGYKTESDIIQWNCGGSLISSRHVLTAAHCIDGYPNLYIVRLGAYNLNIKTYIDLKIERATVHLLYSKTKFTNDIGVLKLEQDVNISGHIKPFCLPIHGLVQTMNLTGLHAYAAGWGEMDSHGALPIDLQEIRIPILPLDHCRNAYIGVKNYYDDGVDDRKICAGVPGHQVPCSGDSGGPLTITMGDQISSIYVVGIIAHGVNICAKPGYPEFFIRVSEYLDFILSQLN